MLQPHLRVRRNRSGTYVQILDASGGEPDPSTGLVALFQYQADPSTVYLEAGGWSALDLALTIPALSTSYVTNSPFRYTAPTVQALTLRGYVLADVDAELADGLLVALRVYRGGRWYDLAANSWTGPDVDGLRALFLDLPTAQLEAGDQVGLTLRAWTNNGLAPVPVEIVGAELRGYLL